MQVCTKLATFFVMYECHIRSCPIAVSVLMCVSSLRLHVSWIPVRPCLSDISFEAFTKLFCPCCLSWHVSLPLSFWPPGGDKLRSQKAKVEAISQQVDDLGNRHTKLTVDIQSANKNITKSTKAIANAETGTYR